MDTNQSSTIAALLAEERTVSPPAEFARQANTGPEIYQQDPNEFWAANGRDRVTWFTPFDRLLEWEPPYAKWYLGGKLNVCYNCVDRHVEAGAGNKVAYHWEGEPADDRRSITYADLQREVVRFANTLKTLGVRRGVPVAIYLGMVPELPVAMLACTRLGAPHTVVFGGFSADSLSGRMNDMGCQVLITQDEAWRRGNRIGLKATADEAMAAAPGVSSCLVVRRTGGEVSMTDGRDVWYHDASTSVSDDPASCPCEPMDSEDLLFLMYTSGTTARPKGIVHTTAGYLAFVNMTARLAFNLQPGAGQLFWCSADIGWVTGHSYVLYGIL
ncbi:MAG TPA: AMP-binding protein, partial [Micromonosporaceae bacterium]